MPSSLTARDINAIASEVGGGDVKGGAKAFGAFMRSMRDKGITLRDVVKSYGITLSSIQRQELPVSTIKKNWPDAPFQEGTKVRPEDAFAQLLGTPEGQKYLDAAESGVFDEQAADAVVQKFRSFGFHNKLKEQMKTAVEQFYPKAQEIIDAVNTMPTDKFIDYVRNNFKGISYGKVGFWSGQLGRGDIPTFDSRQGKLVYGKEVPVTKQVLMEQKDRLTQLGIKVPAAFKDFAQTLLHHEVWDRLNQSDTEHGPIKEAMLRFMPSDTDYLSAVQQGDTQAAQRMVDEAAKAAGYTIGPVYHGTPTGGFSVFDKRMRGETSGISREAFSFTTNKQAAENYSKRLGDEAVRLDAGLRVANDAMRRFDDDVAVQEYFSSKGYSSLEDGMLPEFDWGSIDDVPEFIKELRGHAKDLKPINPDLASSFVEAAKVMTTTKAVPEVKRVFLRIPENAPVFQATPKTLGEVMYNFSAEREPTKSGIVELPGNERIYYVADSSQVKLADPVTKDSQGNVIPLSQRFKATSEDIRYMPAGEAGQGALKRYESVDSFREHWNSLGVRNMTDIRGRGTPYEHIRPSEIEVEKANRNKGLGTAFMQDLTEFADSKGLQIRVNPSDELGATSKGRLEKFYKRFGFVENKPGKNKDYSISERFYRPASQEQRFMPATIQREVGRNLDFANPPTEEKAKAALSSSKQPFWREHESLPEGSPVGVRIDIPAFLNRGTYVQTIHEPATPGNVGDRIGYDTNVRLSGPVRFFVKEGSEESKLGAVAIKEGRAAKHPIATVEGRLIKDRSIPSDIETWTPVGMDPKKHSYFYDKRTDQPVTGGSESFSVGNTVFVKNPVYGNPQDFRFMPSPDSAMPGAYSFQGGYRAIPGKTKGSFRLYGPAGSLIGIASSLDEAQRILRRKAKQ
jgi:GNAT superfamily N-acetyltransferase